MARRLDVEDETVTILFKVPKTLKTKARTVAKAEGLSLSAWLRSLVELRIARETGVPMKKRR